MLPLNTTTCSVAWNHPLKSQKPHGLSDLSTKRLFCLARYSIIAHGLAILRHGAILTGLLLTTRPGAILQPEAGHLLPVTKSQQLRELQLSSESMRACDDSAISVEPIRVQSRFKEQAWLYNNKMNSPTAWLRFLESHRNKRHKIPSTLKSLHVMIF
uniref:Uncharacterized protein n=1 Tax=Molossus molossus TaxID=27622 RepID=A0A7J8JW17_MOLMO|nr:hypothetical protein HJG59_008085 [Molossus molossus]